MLKCIFALSCGLLLLSSACSGPRRIEIDNQTGQKAQVAWGLKPERTPARPFAVTRTDTLYTYLDAKGKESKTGLVFGEGKWNVTEFDRIMSRLVFIQVETEDQTLFRASGRDSLRSLLESGLSQANKRVIRLRIAE